MTLKETRLTNLNITVSIASIITALGCILSIVWYSSALNSQVVANTDDIVELKNYDKEVKKDITAIQIAQAKNP